MFIHWGLYAIPDTGEWTTNKRNIPAEGDAKLADEFIPKHFAAATWAQVAKDAGMNYVVLIACHHGGFALSDSAASFRTTHIYDHMKPAGRNRPVWF